MELKRAKRLREGEVVNIPHLAVLEAYVVRVIEDADPRIKLLVEVKLPPLGKLDQVNYRLVREGRA
jgi:hypothetical protein